MQSLKQLTDKQKELEKFQKLYLYYKDFVLYTAYQVLSDYELAQDVLQETCLYLFKNMDKLSNRVNDAGTKKYIYKTAVHRAVNLLRKFYKNGIADGFVEPGTDEAEAENMCEETVISNMGNESILEEINRLAPIYRDVLYMKLVEDYSVGEIAQKLNLNNAQVQKRIERGKKKLRKVLSGWL